MLRVDKPAMEFGWVVEVDPDFEDGVLGYTEVSAEGCHGDAPGVVL